VVDTNVIVSALLFAESVPGRAFKRALHEGEILISSQFVEELQAVLHRRKFDRYITRDERDEFLETFIDESTLVTVSESVHVCRDPKDNMVLELAVAGSADAIVTGDDDLLGLHPFQGIAVVRPADFLAALDARSPDLTQ
jgi:putative PIN family toxin of toxin-antitoxin system